MKKLIPLTLSLTLLLGLAGCGSSETIQGVLATRTPLLSYLVIKEKITQDDANVIDRDFTEGINCANTLNNTVDNIRKDDPEAKKKKLSAWTTAGNCWSPIVLRQNFAKHPQVQEIAFLVSSIINTGIVFYSDTSPSVRVEADSVTVATDKEKDDKELDKALDEKLKELKNSMKVKEQP